MAAEEKTYIVKRATSKPDQTGRWDTGPWAEANIDKVEVFSDTSSDHRPSTEFKLLYDDEAIYVHFKVQDKYVIALEKENQSNVCRDACVEFFAWPKPVSNGYFNFETNCGGLVLCYYITEWEEKEKGLGHHVELSEEHLKGLNIYHNMPRRITEEIKEDTIWQIEYQIPKSYLEEYMKVEIGDLKGQEWRANFFKCGNNCSKPHWAMWKDNTPPLSFHQPRKFGNLIFE